MDDASAQPLAAAPFEKRFAMTDIVLDPLDFAALLCSRVCHDVIGPVGAIYNGLEVLDQDDDPTMKEFALDLIRKSVLNASSKLQFARLAFGASGSAGASIDLGDAGTVAAKFINDEKVKLEWNAPRALLPKNQVKLLLNMLVLASSAIPRGGVMTADVTVEGEVGHFTVTAKGVNARIPPHAEELLAARSENGSIDAHAIQPYYAGVIARAAGMEVKFVIEADMVTITAAKL
jgi:histidine phosphotransferase ChpT